MWRDKHTTTEKNEKSAIGFRGDELEIPLVRVPCFLGVI